MNIESFTKKLEKEGFIHIYEWTDEPNTEYEEHSHAGRVSFYVLAGDIVMNLNGSRIELKAGDHMKVPARVPHTATVGPKGCTFLVGEEIKGDSY